MTYYIFSLLNLSIASQAVQNDVSFLERDMMKLYHHCKYLNDFLFLQDTNPFRVASTLEINASRKVVVYHKQQM